MGQFVENEWLESVTCGKCGVMWAMPMRFIEARRKDGQTFYCPNGDRRVYRETTEDRLKKDLERERQVREAAEARACRAEQNLSQVARAHRKMRDRVMNGVCPCCNRSFGNLREHMKTEHPDFGEVRTLFALRQAFGMTQAAVACEAGVDSTHVSNYERGKHVASYAKARLDAWLTRQDAASAA